MRVALLSAFVFDDNVGGVENHIRFMVKEFDRAGHEVQIFKPVWDTDFEQSDTRVDGCRIRFVNLGRRPYNLAHSSGDGLAGLLAGFLGKMAYSLRANRLIEEVEAWDPDVVWQHDFSSCWLATRNLSRRFPVVLSNHTGEYLMLKDRRWGRPLLSWLLRHYRAVIGPSVELTPTFRPHSYTIHNGVDTGLFHPLSTEERRRLRLELFATDDAFVVLCPRRWAPTKGVIYLAHAIRELEMEGRRTPKLQFVFAGSDYRGFPRYASQVGRLLEQASLPVLKLGNVDIEDLVSYYQAADLVVIPSLMEAVSLAALEAMAAGVPVLATDVGGMAELIRTGENGYLIEGGNVEALKEAIIAISCDPNRYDVSSRALEIVRSTYSWRSIATVTAQVLREAVRSASRDEIADAG